MTFDPQRMIHGYLDDILSEEEQLALQNWIASDPAHADAFVQAASLHDRMHRLLTATSGTTENQVSPLDPLARKRAVPLRRFRSVWSTVATIAFLVLGFTFFWGNFGPSTASAAYRELDRLIVQAVQAKDKTYRIIVEDVSTPWRNPRLPRLQEASRPPKPSLDQAILHVRQGNQFVLIRNSDDGSPFITGSNGKESWAVKSRGPIRVSSDVHHFSRDLPGHESSIPLTNVREGLERLRRAYEIKLSNVGPEEFESLGSQSAQLLIAVKKPRERGPQRVEIAFESDSGRILHMRFVQMPYGPDQLDLRLNLVDETELSNDFFEHFAHHTPDRRVEVEN